MQSIRLVLAAGNPNLREAVARQLIALGGEVVAQCADPAELMTVLESASADLIIADESMSPNPGDHAELSRIAGIPMLPLRWVLPELGESSARSNRETPPVGPAIGGASSVTGERMLSMIFDHAPLGIALVSMDGRILTANSALCRMMADTPEELCGKTMRDITYPDDWVFTQEKVRGLDQGLGDCTGIEKRNVDRNGRVFWVRVTLALIRDVSGAPVYRLGMIEDIDQQKRLAAQTQARLAAQRNTLVREVHHRIKNNLQAVAGLLRRQLGLHPELADTLETAISQVNTMAIIHGLQGSGENECVRLKELLAGVSVAAEKVLERVLILPPLAGLAGIEVTGEETVPVAMVLNELLLNALKHGGYGPDVPPARISIERGEAMVSLRIENNFDDPGGPLAYTGQAKGSGLKLVQAMLPTQGATLHWFRKEPGVVVTELALSPPVLRFASSDPSAKESMP